VKIGTLKPRWNYFVQIFETLLGSWKDESKFLNKNQVESFKIILYLDPIVFKKIRKLPNTSHNLHFIGFNASSFSSDVLIFFNKICHFFNKNLDFLEFFFNSAILICNFLENSSNILNILKHENVIKGATMGMDNVKNIYIFISLKNHHGNTKIWIVNFVFGIGCITCKVSTTKIWCKLGDVSKNLFACLKNLNSYFEHLKFFKHSFFISIVHHSFSKLKNILFWWLN
jgi:hypothetical protein